MPDLVNNPPHYKQSSSGVECIEVIRYLPLSLASAVKYVWRFEDKWNPIEDLRKALWFLQDFRINNHWVDHLHSVSFYEYVLDSGWTDKFLAHVRSLDPETFQQAFFTEMYISTVPSLLSGEKALLGRSIKRLETLVESEILRLEAGRGI